MQHGNADHKDGNFLLAAIFRSVLNAIDIQL